MGDEERRNLPRHPVPIGDVAQAFKGPHHLLWKLRAGLEDEMGLGPYVPAMGEVYTFSDAKGQVSGHALFLGGLAALKLKEYSVELPPELQCGPHSVISGYPYCFYIYPIRVRCAHGHHFIGVQIFRLVGLDKTGREKELRPLVVGHFPYNPGDWPYVPLIDWPRTVKTYGMIPLIHSLYKKVEGWENMNYHEREMVKKYVAEKKESPTQDDYEKQAALGLYWFRLLPYAIVLEEE